MHDKFQRRTGVAGLLLLALTAAPAYAGERRTANPAVAVMAAPDPAVLHPHIVKMPGPGDTAREIYSAPLRLTARLGLLPSGDVEFCAGPDTTH